MPIDRKAAIREFKERKVSAGIFVIRCTATGQHWVASSPNLASAQNSQFFQLRTGTHRDKELQAAWNQHGEPTFAFEILETIAEETPTLVLSDLLRERVAAWSAQLS